MEFTYAQVAAKWNCSEKTVRRYASKSVPAWRRLKVTKRSARNHVITESALIEFDTLSTGRRSNTSA